MPPVTIEYFGRATEPDWRTAAEKSATVEEQAEMAKYLHDAFENALRKSKKLHLEIVQQAGAQTFVLELALVELVPTRNFVNAAGSIAGFFIPGPVLLASAAGWGTGVASNRLAAGRIAIEMKLKNGETGELLLEALDQRMDKAPLLINARDFTKYGHARVAAKDWADEFVEILETPPEHKVQRASPITIWLC